MAKASYSVEVAWTGQLTGVFTVGVSRIGTVADGGDGHVIAGAFGNNIFDDISADLHSIPLIERGRSSDGGAMQMGRCEIVLNDSTGKYNPRNSASSLDGYLVPLRPIRVIATYSGTDYPLFHGFIESIRHDPLAKKSYITAVDFFERLAVARPTIAATGATTAGAAIGKVLDSRDWTPPGLRALDDGHDMPDFSADATKAGTQIITDVIAVDRGAFFVDGAGITTYHDLSRRYKAQSVVATWTTDMVTAALPATTIRRLVNSQSVTKAGSSAQTASDAASIKAHDTREGSAIESAYLADDAQARSLAEWRVLEGKDPQSPVFGIEMVNADETRLLQILSRELGDYVATATDLAGNSINGWIDHMRHSVDEGRIHTVRYAVARKLLTFFTVGVSRIGTVAAGGDGHVVGY